MTLFQNFLHFIFTYIIVSSGKVVRCNFITRQEKSQTNVCEEDSGWGAERRKNQIKSLKRPLRPYRRTKWLWTTFITSINCSKRIFSTYIFSYTVLLECVCFYHNKNEWFFMKDICKMEFISILLNFMYIISFCRQFNFNVYLHSLIQSEL